MVRSALLRSLLFVALGLSLLAPAAVQAQTAQPKKGTLIGTAWSGRESLAGFGDLTFEFEENNNVTMIDAQGANLGRYTRNGAVITLSFLDGKAIYSGRINGKTMSGTARSPRGAWNWSVKLEDDGVPPPDPDTKPESKKEPPAEPVDVEKKAAELLEQAKKAHNNGNTALARVRCRLIITEYPDTKAAPEAKKLLAKLAK